MDGAPLPRLRWPVGIATAVIGGMSIALVLAQTRFHLGFLLCCYDAESMLWRNDKTSAQQDERKQRQSGFPGRAAGSVPPCRPARDEEVLLVTPSSALRMPRGDAAILLLSTAAYLGRSSFMIGGGGASKRGKPKAALPPLRCGGCSLAPLGKA